MPSFQTRSFVYPVGLPGFCNWESTELCMFWHVCADLRVELLRLMVPLVEKAASSSFLFLFFCFLFFLICGSLSRFFPFRTGMASQLSARDGR